MKLTGKCKEDFLTWLQKERNEIITDGNTEYDLYYLVAYMFPEYLKDVLIVQFFDAQKIFINIKSKFGSKKQRERFSYSLFSFNSGFMWDSRKEALDEAIVNGNNFYNKNR